MKIIDIPDSVTITSKTLKDGNVVNEEEEVTFLKFLEYALDGYAELAKSLSKIRQFDQIMSVIESANGAKMIRFGPADFGVVKSAVEARDWRSPILARKYLPFYDAIEKAQDVKTPVEEKAQIPDKK